MLSGYWTGHQDYFDHTAVERPGWGLDMRRNMDVAYDLHGKYSTDVFAEESVKLITNHNASKPLFLYMAHAAVHSGNPYNPISAKDEYVKSFDNIADYERRRFAGGYRIHLFNKIPIIETHNTIYTLQISESRQTYKLLYYIECS